eukprot:6173151-Pleurochrysis_carterae.AAC.11
MEELTPRARTHGSEPHWSVDSLVELANYDPLAIGSSLQPSARPTSLRAPRQPSGCAGTRSAGLERSCGSSQCPDAARSLGGSNALCAVKEARSQTGQGSRCRCGCGCRLQLHRLAFTWKHQHYA